MSPTYDSSPEKEGDERGTNAVILVDPEDVENYGDPEVFFNFITVMVFF